MKTILLTLVLAMIGLEVLAQAPSPVTNQPNLPNLPRQGQLTQGAMRPTTWSQIRSGINGRRRVIAPAPRPTG